MKTKNRMMTPPLMVMGLLLMFTFSCEKDKDEVPVLTTNGVSDIIESTATCGGNITSDGGSTITARGVCWGTEQTPTITCSKTTDGKGIGSYTSAMTGLNPNATYYVRAYATNSIGTGYGNEITFSMPDSVISFYTGKVNADSIEYFMQQLENFRTRFCLANNRREVASFIRDRFTGMGYADTRLDSFLLECTFNKKQYISWQYNVVATYAGHGSSDSVFILGAHYDSTSYPYSTVFAYAPGADDNASGVAAALEVARIMKAYDYQPEYTLKFVAFGAEELGKEGSWHYVKQAFQRQENIVAMINNDMISYATKTPEEWIMQIQYYDNSEWLTELTRQIARSYTSLNIVDTQFSISSSDSWPFYVTGHHTVYINEGQTTPYYHTGNDKVSGINPQYAAEMVKVSMGLLVYLNGSGKSRAVSLNEPEKIDLITELP